MATQHDLGQYFTTNAELKEKVYEFIQNSPSVILEPSVDAANRSGFAGKMPGVRSICTRSTRK
jgi:hypothetical protein